jgi:putative inorganic carbon (HCO3(-)) transporter
MNVVTSPPADSALRSVHTDARSVSGHALFWAFQGYVMAAVACSSFFPMLFRYQEHAVIVLVVLSLGMCAIERVSPWIKNPLDLPLWLFMIWVLCTVPFATDSAYSFAEWKKFVAQAGVFYWSLLVLDRCRRENLPQQILWALALTGAALAVYSLVDFVDRGGTWRDRYIRANAFGSDYNWLSTYMVMTIPVVGSLIVLGRLVWFRAAQALALALMGGAQLFSYTRGGWLGHAAQGIAFAAMVGGRRLALWVLGLLAMAGAGLLVASQAGFQRDTVAASTVDTRLTVWAIGLRQVATHPVVGIGYGNNSFVKKFPEYSSEAQAQVSEGTRIIPAMHNTFLMVALGSGLPALLSFVWIFVALLRRLIPIPWRAAWNDRWSVLAAGIGLAVIGFAVRNLFDYMFMGSLAHIFWLLAAVGITVTGSAWRGGGSGRQPGSPQDEGTSQQQPSA